MVDLHRRRQGAPAGIRPWVSYATGGGLLAVGTVLILLGRADDVDMLLALAASTVPSFVAAGYAERASRDVRNGTVTEKAKEGALEAIEEKGVVTRAGPSMSLAMTALARILEQGDTSHAEEALIEKVRRRGGGKDPVVDADDEPDRKEDI